jgi:hypothetical protein
MDRCINLCNSYDLHILADEQDLAYCGQASEVKKYTQTPAKAKYNTECWICPSVSCDNVAYHKYGTNLVTTCYADEDPDSAPYKEDGYTSVISSLIHTNMI